MNWIIMPFVNNRTQTEAALRDCLAQTIPDVRILVVDQSRGHDGDWTRESGFDNRIVFWHHDPPLPALAATWNVALRMVWAGWDHALVVNNDVRLPHHLYADLLGTQRATSAWFLSATNVGGAWYPGMMEQGQALTPTFLASRGGPDFSCFLITKECHRWFQFDEGFIPAYHEDNDYHRRLQLAGLGDKIFSVCIPYLHYGSGTLNSDEKLRETWGPKFAACQEYYKQKWGGLPGSETYTIPFTPGAVTHDVRYLYLGQGKIPHVSSRDAAELFNGQAT